MTFARAAALFAIAALAACSPKADEAEKADAAAAPEAPAAPAGAKAMTLAPGLWKTQVFAAGVPTNANRMCYDQAVAEKLGVMGRAPQGGQACTETMTPNPDGSIAFTSTCGGVSTTGVMKGDLNKAYTMEFNSGGQVMKIEATREGDCPADFRPGDMEVQGMKINMLDALKGAN
jgi:hypothetical protein